MFEFLGFGHRSSRTFSAVGRAGFITVIIAGGSFASACCPAQSSPATPTSESAKTTEAGKPAASPPSHQHDPGNERREQRHERAPGHAHQHRGAHTGGAHHQHDFSDVERYAKLFEGPERDAWQKPSEVVKLLELSPGQVVVDLGAGTGYFLPWMVREVGASGTILALDSEPNMVAYVQRRAQREAWNNVVPRRVAPESPGLDPNSVDRILIVNTWHHLPDRQSYGAALERALRLGGFVLVVDFDAQSPIGPPTAARIAPAVVVEELRVVGFEASTIQEQLPYQYVVQGRKGPGLDEGVR